MSRTGFSIRQLINPRRPWPDPDADTKSAFGSAGAKTIGRQYELEQYQQQQQYPPRERHHHYRSPSSWMDINAFPKKDSQKRPPEPIVIRGYDAEEIVAQTPAPACNTTISMPLQLSPLSPLQCPGTPQSISTISSQCSSYGDCNQQYHPCRPESKSVSSLSSTHLSLRLPTPTAATVPAAAAAAADGGTAAPSKPLCSSTMPTTVTNRLPCETASAVQTAILPPPGPGGPPQGKNSVVYSPWPKLTAKDSHARLPASVKSPTGFTTTRGTKRPPTPVSSHGRQKPVSAEDADCSKDGLLQPPEKLAVDDNHDSMQASNGGDDDENFPDLPSSVRQLIRETDKAFRAVGSALAEVTVDSQSRHQLTEPQFQIQKPQKGIQLSRIRTKGSLENILMQMPPLNTSKQPAPCVRSHHGLPSSLSPTSGRGNLCCPRRSPNPTSPLSPAGDILRTSTRATSIKKAKKSKSRPSTPRSPTVTTVSGMVRSDSTPPPPEAHHRSVSLPKEVTNRRRSSSSTCSTSSGHSNVAQRHHTHHRSLSRWTLKTDVTEKLFNGFFHKIEADEVVTPSQVQQFRESRIAKAKAEARGSSSSDSLRSSAGSTRSNGSHPDTSQSVISPIEPFYLADLPSRNGSSGMNLSVLSPVAEVPTPRSFTFELDKDMPREPAPTEPTTPTMWPRDAKQGQSQTPLATPPPSPPQAKPNVSAVVSAVDHVDHAVRMPDPESGTPLFSESPTYSDPPVKTTVTAQHATHKRVSSLTSCIPVLPTIPEVEVKSGQGRDAVPNPHKHKGGGTEHGMKQPWVSGRDTVCSDLFEEDDEYVFLKSTPLSRTVPSFQHGRIRLAKDALIRAGTIKSPECRWFISPDETLDWTAFQMAISGGAGDLYSGPTDFQARDAQEDLINDLCDWLTDCGLSMGALGSLMKTEETEAPNRSTPAYQTANQMQLTKPYRSGSHSLQEPSGNERISHMAAESLSSFSSTLSTSLGSRWTGSRMQVGEDPQRLNMSDKSEGPVGFWGSQRSESSQFFTGKLGRPKRCQGLGIDVDKANTLRLQDQTKPASDRDGQGSEAVRVRQSIDSLPQSPMLEFVLTKAVDGSKEEYVPMGYNLGHDLGDFLKWESENVVMTGYYGSD